MNEHVYMAFRTWTAKRRGGVAGLIATICLTAAAILVLTQALGRQARWLNRTSGDGARAAAEGKIAEGRWRVEVTRQLEEILHRFPYVPHLMSEPDSD